MINDIWIFMTASQDITINLFKVSNDPVRAYFNKLVLVV